MMAEPARTSPLPPRSVIGILGSGQLGKMLAQAASRLGFRTHVYGDDAGPAFDVATTHSVGSFTSFGRLDEFARGVDVEGFIRRVGISTATEQPADQDPAGIVTILPAQLVHETKVVSIHVVSCQARCGERDGTRLEMAPSETLRTAMLVMKVT